VGAEQIGPRRPGRGHLGREPEMGENPPDEDGVFDGGPRACGRHTAQANTSTASVWRTRSAATAYDAGR